MDAESRMDLNDRELAFIDHATEETGQSTTDEKQAEITRRFEELEAQSHTLAERLESAGVSAYRQTPFGLWSYAIHSRQVRKLPAFRRIAIIPAVAQQLRGPMVSALEYFLEKHPFCRFWTFTSGTRVPLIVPPFGPYWPPAALIRNRIAYLNRKISKLNDRPFMKAAGLQIVFRSDEFGTPETDSDGNQTGDQRRTNRPRRKRERHLARSRALRRLPVKGFIPPKKWAAILSQVKDYWHHNWDEGGAITTAREACKLRHQTGRNVETTPDELAELYRQTRRMKLCQPLGALAAEIQQREANRELLVKKSAPNGEGRVYHVVENWNPSNGAGPRPRKTPTPAKLWTQKKAANFCASSPAACRVFAAPASKSAALPSWRTFGTNSACAVIPTFARLIAATADAWQGRRVY